MGTVGILDLSPSKIKPTKWHLRPAKLRTQCFFMQRPKTLIRLGGCPGCLFARCMVHFVSFVMQRLIYNSVYPIVGWYILQWLLKILRSNNKDKQTLKNHIHFEACWAVRAPNFGSWSKGLYPAGGVILPKPGFESRCRRESSRP